MPIETIEPRRLYRQVAEQLRRLIDTGEFSPGDRLPTERDLAAQLGVSRPTVREALIALEVDGRVRIRVGSGIYVTPMTPACARETGGAQGSDGAVMAGPFEIIGARQLFEGAVAAEAAKCANAEGLRKIDALIAAMRKVSHPTAESLALDRAFHVAIADLIGNDVVTRTVADLFDQRMNPMFAALASHFEDGGGWRETIAEHEAVREALASGKSAAAGAAMRRHLRRSMNRFSKSFGRDGKIPPSETTARTKRREIENAAAGGSLTKPTAARRKKS